jgi:outer membrane protein OmpA-like peptidoglycan-associated protein
MNTLKSFRLAALTAAILGVAACAATPHGPPADVVRLQHEQDRLHSDPRIAANGGTELANADAAVGALAQHSRQLDAREYQQGVYLADKLLRVAEASALARDAEHRGEQFAIERDRLTARTDTRVQTVRVSSTTDMAPRDRAPLPDSRARLFAMQSQLVNSESRVDERGLVMRLPDFNFQRGEQGLTSTGEQSLTSLARVLDREPDATVRIVAFGDRGIRGDRAIVVRDYLDARGIDPARLDVREARDVAPQGGARGDVLIVVHE